MTRDQSFSVSKLFLVFHLFFYLLSFFNKSTPDEQEKADTVLRVLSTCEFKKTQTTKQNPTENPFNIFTEHPGVHQTSSTARFFFSWTVVFFMPRWVAKIFPFPLLENTEIIEKQPLLPYFQLPLAWSCWFGALVLIFNRIVSLISFLSLI